MDGAVVAEVADVDGAELREVHRAPRPPGGVEVGGGDRLDRRGEGQHLRLGGDRGRRRPGGGAPRPARRARWWSSAPWSSWWSTWSWWSTSRSRWWSTSCVARSAVDTGRRGAPGQDRRHEQQAAQDERPVRRSSIRPVSRPTPTLSAAWLPSNATGSPSPRPPAPGRATAPTPARACTTGPPAPGPPWPASPPTTTSTSPSTTWPSLLAARGIGFLGWNTRYRGNEAYFLLEHALVDIGAGVRWLREEAGVDTVVILGNSGGGSLMGAYLSQATEPSIEPAVGLTLPDAVLDLPAADLYISLNAHPGRPDVLTAWMDPSVTDETDPLSVDPDLDMFDPRHGPPYDADFVERYRAAQRARNHRITAWVQAELERLAGGGRMGPHLQPAPGVGRPALRRPHASTRPTARPGCYAGDPTGGELRALRHRRHQHAPRLAVDVEPRDLAVPGRPAPGPDHGAVARGAVARRPGRVPERRPRDPRRARRRRTSTSSWCRASTTSRRAGATRWPTSSPRGSRPGPRVVAMAATAAGDRGHDAAGRRPAPVPLRGLAAAAPRVGRRRPRGGGRAARPTCPASTCATPRTRSTSRSAATTPSTATGCSTRSPSTTAGPATATGSSAPTGSSPSRRRPSRCGPGCSARPSSRSARTAGAHAGG